MKDAQGHGSNPRGYAEATAAIAAHQTGVESATRIPADAEFVRAQAGKLATVREINQSKRAAASRGVALKPQELAWARNYVGQLRQKHSALARERTQARGMR